MDEATVVRVKAATARESTLQAGETSKVAVNEDTTKGRERTAKEEKTKEVGKSQEVFTVFVENIPKAMGWKGLWHSFARHGDVVDTFIPRKPSRGGKKFGFMRFGKKIDAERVIERLNGFTLYGFRLSVKMARFEAKSRGGEYTKEVTRVVKRIVGHVEEEELWNLRRSLIGVTASVCSISSIQSRLTEWGLGEIKVQRLGGKSFLLTINDEDLFLMLEDLEWSYLKEIFINVELWSEKVDSTSPRATWIKISGVPLHCWNQITLSRLVELWGSFEALGENANHTMDCEKVSVLITTSVDSKISETVEIEAGNRSFLVRVEEKGLVDCSAQCPVGYNLKKSLEKPEHVEESTTASTTPSSFSASPSKECPWMEVEDDAINAVLVGKEFSNSCFMENCTGKPLGEEELMGRGLKDYKKPGDNDKINDCLVERRALNGAKLMEKADHELGKRWARVVEEIIDKSRVSDHKSNGLEDLGPVQTIGSKFRSSSETNKKSFAVEMGDVLPRASLKVATERKEFRGKKRYGSLWDIQDKALTDLERNKKVRAVG
ncbi:hypothetical protein V6N13_046375 [Hibiscus sabdariffa]